MTHSTLILAIDPGVTSGLAALLDGRLVHTRTANGRPGNAEDMAGQVLVLGLCAETRGHTRRYVVCEQQHMAAGKGFASVRALIASATAWETVAALRGYEVLPRVHPATWRSTMGVRARTRKAAKDQAIKIARLRFGLVLGPDEAEAALLGLHTWETMRREIARRLAQKQATEPGP